MRPLLKTQEKDFQFQSKNKFSKIKKRKEITIKRENRKPRVLWRAGSNKNVIRLQSQLLS